VPGAEGVQDAPGVNGVQHAPGVEGVQDAPGIGAAVHFPDTTDDEYGPGETISVDCAIPNDPEDPDKEYVNTIARAELCAIRTALKVAGPRAGNAAVDIHIATDSLSSIYAIQKVISRPQDLQEHRHLQLLQDICKTIASLKGTARVHIWKVKSHTGILGNERADRAAVAVARGEFNPDDDHTETLTNVPSNNRSHMYWPHTAATRIVKGQPQETFAPLPNLDDALKRVAHPLLKLGQSNRDSLYWQKWQAAKNLIAHEFSHAFLGNSKVPFKTKKLVLQYRWGLLPTQRWLHKCKLSPTRNCPLCGEEDGGHHALSGCKALNAAYIKRHNDAGTEIVEAIAKGSQASDLVLSDVGIRRRRTESEVQHICESASNLQFNRYIKDADLSYIPNPAIRRALATYSGSVPDAFLYHFDEGAHFYTIVEIKYCRDTDPSEQEARAQSQHQALVDLIQEHDPDAMVGIYPLMLGASGAIYNSFMERIEHLGVTGHAKTILARKLHMLAVKHVREIWKLRWSMTTELRKCNRHNWSKAKRRLRLHQAPLHRKAKRRRKR
jgi:ribonuclease HI